MPIFVQNVEKTRKMPKRDLLVFGVNRAPRFWKGCGGAAGIRPDVPIGTDEKIITVKAVWI